MSKTEIFASSIFPCNIMYVCCPRGTENWILMETTSGRRIRIQRHAFVHLACLVSSVAVLG